MANKNSYINDSGSGATDPTVSLSRPQTFHQIDSTVLLENTTTFSNNNTTNNVDRKQNDGGDDGSGRVASQSSILFNSNDGGINEYVSPQVCEQPNRGGILAAEKPDSYRPKIPLDLETLRQITTAFVIVIGLVSLLDIIFTAFWAIEATRQYFPSYYIADFGATFTFSGDYPILNMLQSGDNTDACIISTSVSGVNGGNVTLNQFQSNPNCPFSNCILDSRCRLSRAFNASQYGLSSSYNGMFGNATLAAASCQTVDETKFMALHCEFTDLSNSQNSMDSCIIFNSTASSTSWAYSNTRQLEQMVAYSASSMRSWASLRYCAVRYTGSSEFHSLPARRRLQLGRDVPVDLRIMMVMVLIASVITVFFHYMKAYLVILGYCTKGARSPRVIVWTSSSPLWIAMSMSDLFRTLITVSYQKASLVQLAMFDTLFNVLPHLAPLLYLYYAMPDFPQTALWKTSTVLAIMFFDLIVVILSYTLLNIDNRRQWNEEQVDNELFTYELLEAKAVSAATYATKGFGGQIIKP